MRKFYIKKLGSQELGSPNISGKLSRGRYIYISKENGGFFPYLSKLQNNDTVLIPLVTEHSSAKVYSRLVYHNDKYNRPSGSRDEFRLYITKELDPNLNYFNVGKIAVIEKIDELVDGSVSSIYFVYLFDSSSEYYSRLCQFISDSNIRGNHAIYVGDFDFIPVPVVPEEKRRVIIPEEVRKEAESTQLSLIASVVAKQDEQVRGANLFSSVSFRDFVLHGYDYKCAITKTSIRWNGLTNLEAAHIQPKAHAGTFLPCNGIALCRDMHWAFDKGLITVSDDLKVIVHQEVENTMLRDYSDVPLVVPYDPFFRPDLKYLTHHRSNIFGLFLRSGSIRADFFEL